jgi:hypothetical protein
LFEKGTLTPGVGGTAGSGGNATGGSGGSGTATGGTGATGVCATHTTATETAPQIDDFEDRDGEISSAAGRAGTWRVWNDATSWQQPSAGLPSFVSIARDGSLYAMRTFGGRFTGWGAAVGFNLTECHDASVYSGIRFWLVGNVTVTVSVYTPPTLPVAEGGECQANCSGHFAFRATPSFTEWTEYTVDWKDLQRPAGVTAAFDPARILGLEFSVTAADLTNLPLNGTFDVWIDDVEFY